VCEYDTALFNKSLTYHIICESFPTAILLALNCTLLGRWSPLAKCNMVLAVYMMLILLSRTGYCYMYKVTSEDLPLQVPWSIFMDAACSKALIPREMVMTVEADRKTVVTAVMPHINVNILETVVNSGTITLHNYKKFLKLYLLFHFFKIRLNISFIISSG